MIEGIICLIMAVIFFIYSLFAFKQKGPLLTSMYYISNTMDFYSCNYRIIFTVIYTFVVSAKNTIKK